MSGFDYPWTCPTINKDIESAKVGIETSVRYILTELNPLVAELINLPTEYEDWVERTTQELYNEVEDLFEDTRRTNEDMRKAAESQINDLEEQLAGLQHDYEEQVKELQDEITSLENKLEVLHED
jgi:predicted  nucleic acid-binding Zn-ribbon protein